jgi:hypothetical protein
VPFLDKFESFLHKLKSAIRYVFVKIIALVLTVFFLALALACLSYALTFFMTTYNGKEAKIVSISKTICKHKTACRVGGFYTLKTQSGQAGNISTDLKVYGMYPALPDQLEPSLGDTIKVWPAKKPLVGASTITGWGIFPVIIVFIVGLMMLEFAFLSVRMR